MCGIVGLISPAEKIDPRIVERARDALIHRGPDDAGLWSNPDRTACLAHRRLSILDLSSAGRQPIGNEDGTVWAVHNGEIYNYLSIRRDLETAGHRFRSRTDSEVIVHAYEEWGLDCLNRFRGQFAIGVWDDRAGRLLLARDRLGIKPLYYSHQGERFAFSSELKGMRAFPWLDLTLDPTALLDYLHLARYVPAPKTIYRNVKKLQPGHYLVLENGEMEVRPYWRLRFEPAEISATEAVDRFRTLFYEAVQMRLISDVPVGVFLSGGMDSSSIVAAMSHASDTPVRSFTIGFEPAELSEARFASIVSRRYETEHRERILRREDVVRLMDQVLAFYDEPFADTSAFPTYFVSLLAAREVKVVLSGDGGDELLAGYGWYDRWLDGRHRAPGSFRQAVGRVFERVGISSRRARRRAAYASASPLEQVMLLRGGLSRDELRLLLSPEFLDAHDAYEQDWFLRPHWRADLEPVSALQNLDLHTYLPDDMLTKVDRASMAVSLEVRTPFLDHVLVEFLATVPPRLVHGRDHLEKKWLLRAAMKDELPPEILARGKKGFSIPLNHWLTAGDREPGSGWFTGSGVELGLFRPDFAETVRRLRLKSNRLWGLIVLDRWLARHRDDLRRRADWFGKN